ncbi:hypothetical protein RvY_17919-2 [Ramazzottius varieornatus]|uniref:Globin domain-containing protein n=1 Tax=Ramazzottius varieornatus TaxID=947166 RepID=A0A1D1WAC9_RAMVA|nr:hypothetical protein RvY_17919-2 [Ramazzottius varieornatus]
MDYGRLKADVDVLEKAENPAMQQVDPTTGLAVKERMLVQRTWKELMQLGRSNVGIELFHQYFTKYPQYVQHFKAFREVPSEKLKAHPRLKAHATTVVNAMDVIIDSLDDTGKS